MYWVICSSKWFLSGFTGFFLLLPTPPFDSGGWQSFDENGGHVDLFFLGFLAGPRLFVAERLSRSVDFRIGSFDAEYDSPPVTCSENIWRSGATGRRLSASSLPPRVVFP
jgi:hypothetical protein